MLIDLDYTKEIPKPKLYLAKPNKEILTPLDGIVPVIDYKINDINDLTCEIPAFIEDDGNIYSEEQNKYPTVIKNPLIELIKERYLILVEYNNTKEWFIIIKIDDNGTDRKDFLSLQCFSLGYELKDKDISCNLTSSTLSQILLGNNLDDFNGILHKSAWTVGYIDKKYEDIHREFNFNGSVNQALTQLIETFNCIIEYNTEERKIDIYYRDNYGKDTGIVFDYNKYLKSIKRNRDSDKDVMCTRLKCYGKDGLSIQNVNPTGQEYIDDFTFFMYPFEMDKEGNILKHSNYMTDELCIALVKYKIKIIQNKGKFRELYDRKNTYDKLVFYRKQELDDLKNQLKIFEDKLAVARSSGNSIQEILNVKTQIESDVENKKNEVKETEKILNNIKDSIDFIKEDLSEESNFTNKQLEELYSYVIVDKIETQHIDELDLYKDGLKKLSIKSKPKINIDIDLVNFAECIEEQNMWDFLKLGDKVRVKYPLLNIDEEIRYGQGSYSPSDEVGEI